MPERWWLGTRLLEPLPWLAALAQLLLLLLLLLRALLRLEPLSFPLRAVALPAVVAAVALKATAVLIHPVTPEAITIKPILLEPIPSFAAIEPPSPFAGPFI